MSVEPTTFNVIEVHPDGTRRILPPLTPAELETLRRTFLAEYDPATMELRALQAWRDRLALAEGT